MVWGMGDGGGREDLSCEVEGLLQSPLLQSAWVLASNLPGFWLQSGQGRESQRLWIFPERGLVRKPSACA